MTILYLTYRPPVPISGDRLRCLQQIQLLGRRHDVRVLSCVASEDERRQLESLRPAMHIAPVPLARGPALARMALAALGETPLQVAYYAAPALASAVAGEVAARPVDVVWASIVRVAGAAAPLHRCARVLDYCDALSVQYNARAALQRQPLARATDRLEARRLAGYERRAASTFDATCITSPADADAIGEPRPAVVPLHVEDYLAYEGAQEPLGPGAVVFTGEMGSLYGEASVRWFAERVWPSVAARVETARLFLVGAHPAPSVRALAAERIHVTGYVDDPRAYVAGASVCISPMLLGTGLKTKVIQAMALGRPVVATSGSNQGVGATDGEHLLVADDPAAFADRVVSLLGDGEARRTLGERARAFARARFGAEVVGEGLERVLRTAVARRDERLKKGLTSV